MKKRNLNKVDDQMTLYEAVGCWNRSENESLVTPFTMWLKLQQKIDDNLLMKGLTKKEILGKFDIVLTS